ncbi:GDP-mannose 4,6-dehydratase [Candidatus Pelagibacter sp.]|nr:GDP-mannose 4,6-dehydratase [Candidatus Pelagibacter sp.]
MLKVYMVNKTIMIVGTGVLGSYLSKYFLRNKNKVYVTTRSLKKPKNNYKFHKIEKNVKFIKLNILKPKDISKKINLIKPDLIYYFAGQSSIFLSYKKVKETMNSNYYGALNFLKIIHKEKLDIKFYKASSGYIFEKLYNKNKLFIKYIKPNNPYVESQIKAFKSVLKFRKLGIKCSSLIFFNIESPLKSKHFLLNKINDFIKFKKSKFLKLGNIDVARDFSWAPEIMQGVYYSSNLKSQDIIFGSGKIFYIKDMIKFFFELKDMNYINFIKIDKSLYRKKERIKLISSKSNTIKLLKKWKWSPKTYGKNLVSKLLNT